MSTDLPVLALAVALALAGCAATDDPAATPSGATAASAEPTTEPDPRQRDTEDPTELSTRTPNASQSGTRVTTGSSPFGPMVFDAAGRAIYIWELEESSRPECYDDCETAWPPVLTDGEPRAAGDVKKSMLGTTERSDGSVQVTYNDHPLYYYAHEGPGEVKCHNVSTHGGLWWVVTPAGDRAA